MVSMKTRTPVCLAIIFFLSVLVASVPAKIFAGSKFQYTVVRILDGDTFIATDGNLSFKVRIATMDAPERGQPYSKMAKNRLEQMLKSKNVTIKPVEKGHDRYGRILGHIFLEGQDVAMEMITAGLATYYRPFCKDYPADKAKYSYDPRPYIAAEAEARKLKKNIWGDEETVLPCRYRRL